jgi:hypothetical protein
MSDGNQWTCLAALLASLSGALAACTVTDSTGPSGQSDGGGEGGKGTTGSGTQAGGAPGVAGSVGSGGSLGSAGSAEGTGGLGGSGGAAGSGGSGGSAGSSGSGGSAGSGSVDAGQPHVYTAMCSLPGADAGAGEGGTEGGAPDAVPTAGHPLASFTLYDYETDLPFSGCKEFVNDFVVNITGDNVPLTLVANIAPGTNPGRIIFDQDGHLGVDVERRSPYALGGDSVENNFDPPTFPLAPGEHSITVTAYAEVDPPDDAGDGGLGTVLGTATIKITIVQK